MKLAAVELDELTRKPDTHDIGTQTSKSKFFRHPEWNIEWTDGKIIISHPSGQYLANVLPQERVVGSAELKEPSVKDSAVKDSAKSEAAKKAWAERKAAQT